MAKRYLLGIDVGTTATKTLLLNEQGAVVDSASQSYELITPEIGRCEQNAVDWWNAVVYTVRKVLEEGRSECVQAISLSTQGGTIVPTDAEFNPLANAIVWSDARCAGDKKIFDEALGKDYIYNTCGWRHSRGLPAMQLYRMKRENPGIFASATYFLSVPDYISAKLTGIPAIDISNAGINELTDIKNRVYDKKILDFIGVREEQLPKLVVSGTPIGKLTKAAAEVLGLNENVILCAGAHDQYAVAQGAGICEAGDAIIGTGTAWVVTALQNEPDFESGYPQSLSATEGKWGTVLSITTGGVCLEWFRKNVVGTEDHPLDFDTINRLAAECDTPGVGGLRFFPYFTGAGNPVADPNCKGTFLGIDLSHGKAHIIRAIMEGVACQIVWAMQVLSERHPIERLMIAGGATKSPVWLQIIAEIAGRELYVSDVADLACVGAGMLAGVGCGMFADNQEAAKAMRPEQHIVKPDPQHAEAYKKVFEDYCRGAKALRSLYNKGV